VNIQVQSQDLSFSMRITDLSFTGLGVVSEVQLELGQPYVLEFNLPNQRQVKLKAIVKNNTDSRFGLQIVQSDYEYEQFVSSISLERGKLKKVA
jgi:tRNA U54 and U55 pseudouridine synthase Pus10